MFRGLCLSKISKCLSVRELYFLSNSLPMLILLTTLLGTLSSMFRSRVAIELRELGSAPRNRGASTLHEKTLQVDPSGPPVLGLAVPPLERLACGTRHRQARNGRGLASCRLSPVLGLEGPARPTRTGDFPRDPRSDPVRSNNSLVVLAERLRASLLLLASKHSHVCDAELTPNDLTSRS